jgi:hypothetical protein
MEQATKNQVNHNKMKSSQFFIEYQENHFKTTKTDILNEEGNSLFRFNTQ